MQYLADEGEVIYSAKNSHDRNVFDALEWLAAMCSNIPNRGEQMVRYYGWHSNDSRGKRQKEPEDVSSTLGSPSMSTQHIELNPLDTQDSFR